jgi:hypothetical protein
MGGGNYVSNGDSPGDPRGYTAFNDCWSSADGAHWECCTDSAPWFPRIWFSALAYRDRLWVLGGWSSSGLHGSNDALIVPTEAPNVRRSRAGSHWNWGDVWYSVDGTDWYSYEQEAVGWKERHALSAAVLSDELYVWGGHAQPLSNEVWKLSLPEGW